MSKTKQKLNKQRNALSRRRFLGMSALGTAATLGLGLVSISSCKTGLVFDPEENNFDIDSHYPAIVVGTGYGGSVAALRLGEAGIQTLMVEMGQLWDKPADDGKIFNNMFKVDGRSYWFKDKATLPVDRFLGVPLEIDNVQQYAGVLDRVDYDNMSIYLGRGVGGGSLVNGGIAVVPKRSWFEKVFPNISSSEMYGTYFPLANQMLRATEIPDDIHERSDYYKYSRVGRKSAEKAGFKVVKIPNIYDFNYMRQEEAGTAPKSAYDTELLFGNNHGRQSLDKTYLADALGTGNVSIKTLTKVTKIEQSGTGGYKLELQTIDTLGQVVAVKEVTCDQLFLGAGSLGTTELLMRAKETGALPNLSPTIGAEWNNNGSVAFARANRVRDKTGSKQSMITALGIDRWDDSADSVLVEITPFPAPVETWVSHYLALTNNPEKGYFTYNAQTDTIKLHWGPNQNQPAVRAAKKLFDTINRKNWTAYRYDLFDGGKPYSDDFTYHPLGGCILGKDTNLTGAVNGYHNLYVVDGALIPGALGANPFVTITALAERNMAHILSNANS